MAVNPAEIASIIEKFYKIDDELNLDFDYSPDAIAKITSDQGFNRAKRKLLAVTLRDLRTESQQSRNLVSQKIIYEIYWHHVIDYFLHVAQKLNSATHFHWSDDLIPLAIVAHFQNTERPELPVETHFTGVLLIKQQAESAFIDTLLIWPTYQRTGLGERAYLMLELLISTELPNVKAIELIPAEDVMLFWRHKLGFHFKWDPLEANWERVEAWRDAERIHLEAEAKRLQMALQKRQSGQFVPVEDTRPRPFVPLARPDLPGLDWSRLEDEDAWTMIKYIRPAVTPGFPF